MPQYNSQEIETAAKGPLGLAVVASPYDFDPAPHLQALNKKLIKAWEEHDVRQIVSMPPRHGKSELTSAYNPAWGLCSYPNRQVILASYETTFAAEWGGRSKEIVADVGPDIFGVQLDPTTKARDYWRVGVPRDDMEATRRIPWSIMRTAGLGGPVSGKGADILIVDDPVKNHEEALSAASRESKWQWWQSTAYPRLHRHGSAIVVQTRWHEDDLAGRLIQQSEDGIEHWDVLNLPAIAEEDDPLGREPGEALWPAQFPVERLEQIKATLGPYWFGALYQGRPSPLEGNIFKRDWFRGRYVELPKMHRVITVVDAAFKTGLENDFSVIATWGTDGVDYYVINVVRRKMEFHELKSTIAAEYWSNNPSAVYIENAAAGISIIQEMQRESMIPVIGKPVAGNDMSRALAITGICEARKVKLPARASWVPDWIEEHVAFPNASHDDQVTTSYYALEELAYAGAPIMTFV